MAIDIAVIRSAIERIDAALAIEGPRLTELDGKLGDGDLGITLAKAFAALKQASPDLPDDLGKAFFLAAAKVSEVSSSSFGTLFSTALMAAGKALAGRTSFEWTEIAGLLQAAQERMMARGKAALGDKTVLDAMQAAIAALDEADSPITVRATVGSSVTKSIEDFTNKPNKIGRARIFADRSVGLPDPGMVAFKVLADAI